MALRWYAARTKPQGEYPAVDGLRRAGFDVFAPCIRTPRPRRGHQDTPLFPGYLFVRHDLEEHGWPPLHRIPHVIGLVQFGGVAPSVPDGVVAEMWSRIDTFNGAVNFPARFVPGQSVRIVSGAMDSLAEVVEEAGTPRGRVQVLLEFLGRRVSAQVPSRCVWEMYGGEISQDKERRAPRRTRGKGRWIRGFGPLSTVNA